jgi:hypothetical protein
VVVIFITVAAGEIAAAHRDDMRQHGVIRGAKPGGDHAELPDAPECALPGSPKLQLRRLHMRQDLLLQHNRRVLPSLWGLTGIYRGLNGIEGQSSAWRVGDQAGKLKHTLPLNRNRDCSLGGDSANRGYHLGIAVRQGWHCHVELIESRLHQAGVNNRRCDASDGYLN